MMREESPRRGIILLGEQNPQPPAILAIADIEPIITVQPPDDTQKQRPRRRHDGDIRQQPAALIARQFGDDAREERMARDGREHVVRDAGGFGFARDGGVLEEGLEGAFAAVVEIQVNPAVVVENEVPDRVGALDRVRVRLEGVQVLGVVRGDEVERGGVGPQLVLPLRRRVEGLAGGLRGAPDRGDLGGAVGLVDDAGDEGGAVGGGGGRRGGFAFAGSLAGVRAGFLGRGGGDCCYRRC